VIWLPVILGFLLLCGGAYVFAGGRGRTRRFIMSEDGGRPVWLFSFFYKSYYLKYKIDQKHRARFPDNYFEYLVSSGLAMALAGAMLFAFSLMALLRK